MYVFKYVLHGKVPPDGVTDDDAEGGMHIHIHIHVGGRWYRLCQAYRVDL